MDCPQRQERRDIRYPVHLPVLLKLAHQAMHARSENISVGGILVSSARRGGANPALRGCATQRSGQVLRVQPQASGSFALAIAFERPLELGRHGLDSGSEGKGTSTPPREK
jgi:hypothetical protein